MKKKYTLLAVALILATFSLDYYFLKPRSEALRDSIAVSYNSMLKDEVFLKGATGTAEGAGAASTEVKELEKGLITEKSEFLAAARLQAQISDIAEKAGLKVLTIRPLPVVKMDSYRDVPIYFEGNGTMGQMGEFLKYVEEDGLMIKVDKLGLNITNMQNPKELKFKIQLSGLAKV